MIAEDADDAVDQKTPIRLHSVRVFLPVGRRRLRAADDVSVPTTQITNQILGRENQILGNQIHGSCANHEPDTREREPDNREPDTWELRMIRP